ncbi:MAG: gliding motility-associated C-terminal domain-containing protein [Bacteroidota bacterium]
MRFVGKIIFVFFFALMAAVGGWSQACTTLGQNPYSAFPVCGSTNFQQNTVPVCGINAIPTFCPKDGNVYLDKNPFWYKFTCYTAGTLAILIRPNNLSDDYDWQLFDITGHDPIDVYTNSSLIVSYNWSGEQGVTGTSPNAANLMECGSTNNGPKIPIFSKMPVLVAGHEYLLMISHFSGGNQSGYALSFPVGGTNGGTASIVNPVVPKIQSAYAICDGSQVMIKLASRVNCTSIAADGTDFTISGPVSRKIIAAKGNGCNAGFDSDSILVTLDNPLSPGTYTLTSQIGTDGNTLSDNCGNALLVGEKASLKFVAFVPTPLDSISPVVCIKDTLQLVFSKPMACSSIAADGSDFTITGPVSVSIKTAFGTCSNGVSTTIQIVLTAPIRVNGTFTILLKNGTDGNPLIDECGLTTPAGSTLSFTTKNITTADFTGTVSSGCKTDTIYLAHNGYGGTTQWQWRIDSVVVSTSQNPFFISKAFGAHALQLAVSNGICSDTARTSFVFTDHSIKASFAVADTLCPTDTLHFTDLSTANTISWQWNFGNGVTSTQQIPGPQSYPLLGRRSNYTTRLVATNQYNCSDTTYKIITVLASCYIAVPSAFTPNGDGLNDYLYPLNAFKADNLLFRVYNRYGQIIFEARDWTKKWDGRVNSIPQPSGTYVWTLDYINRDNGQRVSLKGTAVLIR